MIVQCEACQTRFRLADEKVKPGGTKVRCSKCKEIFTVTPPAPEPEPVEDSVDFGSFNMEDVTDESQESVEPPAEDSSQDDAPPTQAPEPEIPDEDPSDDVDFSGLEAEMGGDDKNEGESAEDFSFADTSEPAEDQAEDEPPSDFHVEEFEEETKNNETEPDIGAAFAETEESESPESMEFDFDDETEADNAEADSFELDSFNENEQETSEFSFDDKPETPDSEKTEEAPPGEFSFDEGDSTSFSFDEEDEAPSTTSTEDEFSFDEETPFDDESPTEWEDGTSSDGDSFDFDEPQFDTHPDPAQESSGDEGGLQFGEIDFASEDDDDPSPASIDEDFSGATLETQSEQESFTPQEHESRPSQPRDDDIERPLPAPPPKKSSLSRIVLLLVLLLVILGGAAAFLFMQGTVNLNMVTEYLPFLKEYIGETEQLSPADSIDIEISDSSYVNNVQAGQMLVIQGAAINKHPKSRSSITIKGVLLDANGRSLLQQTVFCGNPLSTDDLESMPFKQIEEAMNNEFGAGLSNMNISPGDSIPFTIVFRNLPDGIANINVEVVDSKPGAN